LGVSFAEFGSMISAGRETSMLQHSFFFGAKKNAPASGFHRDVPVAVILNDLSDTTHPEFQKAVEFWLGDGAVMFAATGPNANAVEDAADWIIEDLHKFEVVTTAHSDETSEEVLEFAIFSMRQRFGSFRLVVLSPDNSATHEELLGLIDGENPDEVEL
jgi:hypothetical protein